MFSFLWFLGTSVFPDIVFQSDFFVSRLRKSPAHPRPPPRPPPRRAPQILRNDGLLRPLIVTTVDRLDLVMGLMGAQVGLDCVRFCLDWVDLGLGWNGLGLMGAQVGLGLTWFDLGWWGLIWWGWVGLG